MPYLDRTITMPLVLEALYQEMVNEITILEIEDVPLIMRCRKAVPIIQEKLQALKVFVKETGFADQEAEIHFFKRIKPRFHSQLVYHLEMYHFESALPHGSKEAQILHLDNKLHQQQQFIAQEAAFYQYWNSGATYLDHLYFVRGRQQLDINLTPSYINADEQFATSHDYLLSGLLAAEMLSEYLSARKAEIASDQPRVQYGMVSNLTWTGHKNFLIELIYALYSFGAFNHGKSDIKLIADTLERTFNVKLGNIYRTFQEIRIRKKGQTFFLDQLIKRLQEFMDQQDEHPRF